MVPLLAACAAGAPQWDKPGAAQAAIEEDMQKCRVEGRLSPEPRLAGPSPTTSGTPLVDRGQERDAQEAQEVRKCMEGKGYRLKG
ncbi:MAG TPA: hypothetical protein VNZ59_21310 [Burkholderiales bacterium]|nr:hypothetical protein [Burkholderiales bacterium]